MLARGKDEAAGKMRLQFEYYGIFASKLLGDAKSASGIETDRAAAKNPKAASTRQALWTIKHRNVDLELPARAGTNFGLRTPLSR